MLSLLCLIANFSYAVGKWHMSRTLGTSSHCGNGYLFTVLVIESNAILKKCFSAYTGNRFQAFASFQSVTTSKPFAGETSL